MVSELLIGLILTVLPVTELRLGLPVVIHYCLKNNISIWPFFFVVLFLNILVIFLIYFFLENFHNLLMPFKPYKKTIGWFVERNKRKAKKLDEKIRSIGFVALALFVGIPLPGTGAWTGTIIAWILGLNKRNSIFAISAGVILAGILVSLASLGIFSLF
jgi:uncharacterized membrane protein